MASQKTSLRPFPEVDPSKFNEAGLDCQRLMAGSIPFVEKIGNSKEFAKQLISAAQESKHEEVDRLIKEAGVPGKVQTKFNPDGILLEISNNDEQCGIVLRMNW
jgi:hypothetical protein